MSQIDRRQIRRASGRDRERGGLSSPNTIALTQKAGPPTRRGARGAAHEKSGRSLSPEGLRTSKTP